MTIESRKEIYTEVERIREEIDNAFDAWRLQDISVGQPRPTVEDLVAEIETVLHSVSGVESKVTRIGKVVERNGKRVTLWEAV
jgi:hypothetical protein